MARQPLAQSSGKCRRGTSLINPNRLGPILVCRQQTLFEVVLKWLTDNRIDTEEIDPGKPWQNGTNSSFNGKLRDECLSLEWFRSRREARVIIEAWRKHYNTVRPHRS
jgi:hypothetical protein